MEVQYSCYRRGFGNDYLIGIITPLPIIPPYFFHTAAVQLNSLLREKILCHKHAFYILRISRYHFKQR